MFHDIIHDDVEEKNWSLQKLGGARSPSQINSNFVLYILMIEAEPKHF